jgi:hypothetical protein
MAGLLDPHLVVDFVLGVSVGIRGTKKILQSGRSKNLPDFDKRKEFTVTVHTDEGATCARGGIWARQGVLTFGDILSSSQSHVENLSPLQRNWADTRTSLSTMIIFRRLQLRLLA